MRYRSKQPVKRYIYNHTSYHTFPKIADKFEVYRTRHLKASAKLQVKATKEENSSEDKDELLVEAVASKKKWTNKKNGYRKFNPNSSDHQKSHNNSQSLNNSGATKKRPFCRYFKKNVHIQDARKRDKAPCYSQKR